MKPTASPPVSRVTPVPLDGSPGGETMGFYGKTTKQMLSEMERIGSILRRIAPDLCKERK